MNNPFAQGEGNDYEPIRPEQDFDSNHPPNDKTDDKADSKASAKDNEPSVADQLKQMRGELGTLRSQLQEARADAEYWSGRAHGKRDASEPEPEPEPDVDPESINPDEFLDMLAKDGPKALRKVGFVPMSEVRELASKIADSKIGEAQASMVEDARITQEFPDLANEKSDFFKAVAAELRDVTGGKRAATRSEIRLAARMVNATNGTGRDDGDSSIDRLSRIGLQSGPSSTRRGAAATDDRASEGDEELTASQRSIASKLGLSEDEYRKHAKRGVNITSRSSSPRRGDR